MGALDGPFKWHRLHGWGAAADDVVRYPRAPLLSSGTMERVGTVERLHIQVGDIGLAIRQLHAYLELLVQHHVVFPQSALSIVYTQDTLLHLHLVGSAAPRDGVVFALLASGAGDGHTAFRKGEASTRTRSGNTRRRNLLSWVTTLDVLR